jgi:hypothetical protein
MGQLVPLQPGAVRDFGFDAVLAPAASQAAAIEAVDLRRMVQVRLPLLSWVTMSDTVTGLPTVFN